MQKKKNDCGKVEKTFFNSNSKIVLFFRPKLFHKIFKNEKKKKKKKWLWQSRENVFYLSYEKK